MPRSPRFGSYGVALQLALALGLGLYVSAQRASELGPSDHLVRGVAIGLLFGVPGVIAAFGVRASRPSLLIAAVVIDMAGALVSFASLVFVVPAGLFVAHAAATAHGRVRLAAAIRASIVGVAVVGLTVGAGVALLALTESRCWTAYATPTGVEYRFTPYLGNGAEQTAPVDSLASGCDTGVLTVRGEATAAVLALGAIALAGLASRPRSEPVPDGSSDRAP